MPIFECSKCGCVENTTVSNYWEDRLKGKDPLCSECDPKIGKWHNKFPKESAKGYLLGSDGYLYHEKEADSNTIKWRIEHQGFHFIKEII